MNRFLSHFLRYFLPSTLLVVGLAYLGIQQAQETKLNSLKSEASKKVLTAKSIAIEHLDLVARDIIYISNSELLRNALNTPFTSSDDSNSSLDALARDWQAIMAASPIYDQLRWIDETGQERLRIDHSDAEPVRVAEDKLQDKSGRYFFVKANQLQANQIYLSPFDLNVENGVIDVPYKPMIRFAKAVVDERGVKRGIVILNYLGDGMLQLIKQLKDQSSQKIWLTNEQGYWLLGCNSAHEWGFMLDKPELTVSEHYPEAWQTISNQERDRKSVV